MVQASDLEKESLRIDWLSQCLPPTSYASVSLFRSERNHCCKTTMEIKWLVTTHSIFSSKWRQYVDCAHHDFSVGSSMLCHVTASGWTLQARSPLVPLSYLLPSLVENGRGFGGDGTAGPPCPGLLCGGHPLSWLPGRKPPLLSLDRPCSSNVPSVSTAPLALERRK